MIRIYIIVAMMLFPGSAFAFNAVPSDFRNTFNATGKITGTKTFLHNENLSGITPGIRVFIPQGTTYVGLTLYYDQNAKTGVAVRVDNFPQCTYGNCAASVFGDLPWDGAKPASLPSMRTKDYQIYNSDGQIEILGGPVSGVPVEGHWLYVKRLGKKTGGKIKLQFSVNVAEYNAWYANAFSGSQVIPGSTPSGPTGTACEQVWTTCGGQVEDPGEEPNVCDPGQAILCMMSRNRWDPETCTCISDCNQSGRDACVAAGGAWDKNNCSCKIPETLEIEMSLGDPAKSFTIGTETKEVAVVVAGAELIVLWSGQKISGRYVLPPEIMMMLLDHKYGAYMLGQGKSTGFFLKRK